MTPGCHGEQPHTAECTDGLHRIIDLSPQKYYSNYHRTGNVHVVKISSFKFSLGLNFKVWPKLVMVVIREDQFLAIEVFGSKLRNEISVL